MIHDPELVIRGYALLLAFCSVCTVPIAMRVFHG